MSRPAPHPPAPTDAAPSPWRRLGATSAGVWRAAVDLTLPPRCLACGVEVDRQGGLCPGCWGGLSFIVPPLCEGCGLPFELPTPPGTACAACLATPRPFRRARAVLRYDDASKPLLLGFKHGDRVHAAPVFGAWLLRAGADLMAEADVVLPVPLHWGRLVRRRYNQAALLAAAVAAGAGLGYAPGLLVRRRPTVSQGTLDRTQRQSNVAGAFAVTRRGRRRLLGRRVVLVDDVLTSGATAAECARVLLRAGAMQVEVLALARVVT